MKATKRLTANGAWIAVWIALSMGISACSGWFSDTKETETAETAMAEEGPMPLYYDFGDVLIPSELKTVKKSSFVFKTPGLSAGVLSLKGRVEVNSLIAFFESNMTKDNWRQVSAFKSNRSMLLYKKQNRWCVINITEKEIFTYVEIWVAPTVSESDSAAGTSGLLYESTLEK